MALAAGVEGVGWGSQFDGQDRLVLERLPFITSQHLRRPQLAPSVHFLFAQSVGFSLTTNVQQFVEKLLGGRDHSRVTSILGRG